MKRFALIFMMLVLFGSAASAQVIDVRAISRQRGFKAYQPSRQSPQYQPSRQRMAPVAKEESVPPSEGEKLSVSQNQPEKKQKQIHQTGIKIFQEKDEDKIMNFDVENPEFRKLNKKQQQDLLNRITIE
ncbi:MAG: hypothetical protein IJ752_06360 [Alphaproteobacteria bacterium]|nr:hypothetical protein [Alphaproteobacteria bacterium]